MIKNNKTHNKVRCEGQALIGVLAVVAIASVMVVSLVLTSLIGADASLRLRQSSTTLNQADAALHNAILQLERNPNYTGETLTLSDGRVIIEITGENPKIVLAKSVTSDNKILRQLQVDVSFDENGSITVDNWQEL